MKNEATEAEREQCLALAATGMATIAIARQMGRSKHWVATTRADPEKAERMRANKRAREARHKRDRAAIVERNIKVVKPAPAQPKRPETERAALIREATLAFAQNQISRQELSQRLRAI